MRKLKRIVLLLGLVGLPVVTQAADPPPFYILVSLSIPANVLKAYCVQAKPYNATLVLRGLKDNSLKATAQYLRQHHLSDCPWQVAPRLFHQLQVTAVPLGVLFKQPLTPGQLSDNTLPDYVSVSGNITLHAMHDFLHQQLTQATK